MQIKYAYSNIISTYFTMISVQFSSVSHSVMSNSFQPHELQQARPPCPSPTQGFYSNSCPLSQWCHPTISVVPFFSCLQSFPASGSFPMSQLFEFGDERIGVSDSTSVPPMNSGLTSFRVDWLDIHAVQGTLKSLLQHHSSKASILRCSGFFIVQLSHPYMTTGKIIALTRWTFVGKVMSQVFNMLSRLVTAFLLRSKHLLISETQFWPCIQSWLVRGNAHFVQAQKNMMHGQNHILAGQRWDFLRLICHQNTDHLCVLWIE